jgi:hypothetical protein
MMFETIQKPNKILNKFTKNIHLEKIIKIPSSQIDDEILSPSKFEHPNNNKQLKVKPNNPNDIILPIGNIPDLSSHSTLSDEMKNNAFEIVIDQNSSSQNLHPLDVPLTLRNGKKIYPSSPTVLNFSNKLHNAKNGNIHNISIDDIINLIYSLFYFISSIIVNFWNMDLHFNVTISEDNTMKLHIPTVIFSVIFLKIIYSLINLNQNKVYHINEKSNSSTSGIGLLPLIIIFSIISYWYYNLNIKNTKQETKNVSKPVIKHNNQLVSNEDNQSFVDSYNTEERNSLWDHEPNCFDNDSDSTPPLTRMNSLTTKLETLIHKNKPIVDKSNHPIHRQEERQKSPRIKHHPNLPLLQKRKTDSDYFDDMTRARREEMLNAFNY